MDNEPAVLMKENPTGNEDGRKPKVVVVMGPTGSGKSKLAIDLASHFPVEIINADSMQVYRGLDVLTNKVPLPDQNVPHHLLGTVSPNTEFTSKDFRDAAIPLINEIVSRNCLPVIVGGTNYYIQALVSPFLLDDTAEDFDDSCLSHLPGDEKNDHVSDVEIDNINFTHDVLRDLDPVAADRMHPNNYRKITQYLRLYARSGVLPSEFYQGKAAENWGRMDYCRYDCCFICVDAATPVLDHYIGYRVDCMIDAGLLGEVYEIYNVNADYTRGLRQAIGVREFEDLLKVYLLGSCNGKDHSFEDESLSELSPNMDKKVFEAEMVEILDASADSQLKVLLADGIDKVKMNTRRLVRRQKRMLTRLQTLFQWNLHYVDATKSISSKSDEAWTAEVVGPAVEVIRSFLSKEGVPESDLNSHSDGARDVKRNLWTQYICKACGNRVLRGDHEWEQHKQGKSHRKRISRLRKSQGQLVDS